MSDTAPHRPSLDPVTEQADGRDVPADGLFPEPAPAPPQTGDELVDGALRALHGTLGGSLDEQLTSGERVDAVLQGRLRDLADA